MKKILVITATALTLAACSHIANNQQLHRLQNYQVEWIGERPLIDRSMLTFSLADEQYATGFAGCNNWSARYQLGGKNLTLSNISSTRKLCAPALMEQEQRFLSALTQVQYWSFNEIEQLQLWPQQGSPIKLWPINP